MRDQHDLAESARHEAGHAIVRLVLATGPLHRIVVLVELDATGCGGFIEAKPDVFVKDRPEPKEPPEPPASTLEAGAKPENRRTIARHLHQIALETYAGVAAQDFRTAGDWFGSNLFSSSRTDRRLLAWHHRLWGWELDEDRFDGALLRSARRLVDRFWGPLVVMEDLLLERLAKGADGELSGDEVRRILATTPSQRNPWREREFTKAELEALRAQWRREAAEYDAQWRERQARGPRAERRAGRFLDPGPLPGGLVLPAPLAGLLVAEAEA